MGPLVQERDEVGHKVEFSLATFTPAKFKRRHKVGELLAVKYHSMQDGIDEGPERLGRQPVVPGEYCDLFGLLLCLELLVTVADCGFVEAFAFLE